MQSGSPALKDVAFLIGDWSIVLSNASFLPKPNQKISFSVSYRWIEQGTAIAVAQGDKDGDSPQSANWIIGRDEGNDNYTVLYGDSRGVSRVYSMSFKDDVWKMWRDNPKFSQRFEGKVGEDRKTIHAKWEKSVDGGKSWEHDFDMLYSKV
jgi:hypothetical protein